MEKLIVKNFGPIKEAEIELAKYVVFIGDTSTGKSVLAKLIAIFRDGIYKLSYNNKVKSITDIFNEELKRLNIDFDRQHSEMFYFDNDSLVFSFNNRELKFHLSTLKDEFDIFVEELLEKINENKFSSNMLEYDKNDFKDFIFKDLSKKVSSIYIPAERILYSMIGNSINGLWSNNVSISDCYKEFAANFEVARRDVNFVNYKSFEFSYSFEDGNDNVYFSDKKLKLSEASSGIQSLLPLLLVIDREVKHDKFKYDKSILIEEPELSLFPIKQKRLIDYVVSKFNETNDKLIITTHSPYILSSLDTLILAKNTFNENQDLKDKISDIVHESRWIDYDDIAVYEVRNDGKVYSIKNEEFKSIDSNAIDSVSDIISNEFDKLTELRYARKF